MKQHTCDLNGAGVILSAFRALEMPLRFVSDRVFAQKTGHKIPFLTCVTDLGEAHPWWFNPEADKVRR